MKNIFNLIRNIEIITCLNFVKTYNYTRNDYTSTLRHLDFIKLTVYVIYKLHTKYT